MNGYTELQYSLTQSTVDYKTASPGYSTLTLPTVYEERSNPTQQKVMSERSNTLPSPRSRVTSPTQAKHRVASPTMGTQTLRRNGHKQPRPTSQLALGTTHTYDRSQSELCLLLPSLGSKASQRTDRNVITSKTAAYQHRQPNSPHVDWYGQPHKSGCSVQFEYQTGALPSRLRHKQTSRAKSMQILQPQVKQSRSSKSRTVESGASSKRSARKKVPFLLSLSHVMCSCQSG